MRILILLIIVSVALPCSAQQKCFYDPVTKLMITDISGVKTKIQIETEFNLGSVQEIIIDEKFEAGKIVGNTLVKYDYKQANKDIQDLKKVGKDTKKNLIKTKLGLTEKEWNDLKEALE